MTPAVHLSAVGIPRVSQNSCPSALCDKRQPAATRSFALASQSWHHSSAVSSGSTPLEASCMWRSPMRSAPELGEEVVEALAAEIERLGVGAVAEAEDAVAHAREVGPFRLQVLVQRARVVGNVALAVGGGADRGTRPRARTLRAVERVHHQRGHLGVAVVQRELHLLRAELRRAGHGADQDVDLALTYNYSAPYNHGQALYFMNAPLSSEAQETLYLGRLGERVRAWRTEHGMTRKALAAASGVSERYLAQLEAGHGNISVLLLRRVARAMSVPVEHLVREDGVAAHRARRPRRPARRRQVHARREARARARRAVHRARPRGGEGGRCPARRGIRHVRPGRLPPLRAPRARARAERAGARGDRHRRQPGHRSVELRAAARALPLRLAQGVARGAHGARHRAGRHASIQGAGPRRWTRSASCSPTATRLYARAAAGGRHHRQVASDKPCRNCARRCHDLLRHPPRPLQPLEARLRRPGRHAGARRGRGQGPRARATS